MSIPAVSNSVSQVPRTADWHFSKKHLNILVDACIFLAFLALVFSGFLMAEALPRGSAGGRGQALSLWGMNRHQWADLHLWVAFGFVSMIAVHLLLHRTWIWGAVAGSARAGKFRRYTAAVVLICAVALAFSSVALPYILKADAAEQSELTVERHGRQHRQGWNRGVQPNHFPRE